MFFPAGAKLGKRRRRRGDGREILTEKSENVIRNGWICIYRRRRQRQINGQTEADRCQLQYEFMTSHCITIAV